MKVTLTVNGTPRAGETEPRTTLLDFLRDSLGLTGTHMGCEHGVCGACSVIFDGAAMRSCLMFAVMADGHEVTTVEGLCKPDGSPGRLQESFQENHGMQCGYCTPGMLISAQALLDGNPNPSHAEIREAISANLCRCTGYIQIIESIADAAKKAD
jgi:aerobic carbon-monoxide dehydrogenase small subunit